MHLSRIPSQSAAALAELLTQHPSHELVIAGDFFELALDPPGKDPSESIGEILSSQPELSRALARHLEAGAPLTLLANNHDASVASAATHRQILKTLGVSRGAPLSTFPWFIRRAGVHIEHGHFYDPDNAPTHPLSLWNYQTEPLGVAMTRRFVAPNGAMMFAGAYETTPLSGLLRVLSEYRLRAPLVIANYFATAGALCVGTHGRRRALADELERGALELAAYSQALGVEPSVLQELLGTGARPTHHRFRDTFMRLYFDRIFATLGTAGGLLATLLGNPQGLLLAGLGVSYLATSVTRQGQSRYQNLPGERLRQAAARVRQASQASVVIFGHTHIEDDVEGYLNLGSFGFARQQGRSYAEIDARGEVRRLRFS